jgi:hypothetical protein
MSPCRRLLVQNANGCDRLANGWFGETLLEHAVLEEGTSEEAR